MELLFDVLGSPLPFVLLGSIICLFLMIGFVAISASLVYHWRRYGMSQTLSRNVLIIYFIISSMLFASCLISGLIFLSLL